MPGMMKRPGPGTDGHILSFHKLSMVGARKKYGSEEA